MTADRRIACRLSLVAALGVFCVIVASAWLRHSHAGLACADWPACYASLAGPAEGTPGTVVARLVHRLAASGALVLILLIPFLSLDRQRDRTERRIARVALVIALALAALGIATPDASVAAVAVGNLAGGFALFATLIVLASRLRAAPVATGGRAVASLALAVTCVHVLSGVMIGAQFAATACPPTLACPGADLATLAGAPILDATAPFVVSGGRVVAPPGGAALIVLHRLLSIAVVVLALAAAFAARADRVVAAVIAASALAAAAMGAVATLAQPSLVATQLHNAFAALLVAALAAAAFRPAN